jgi:hypothetical protein
MIFNTNAIIVFDTEVKNKHSYVDADSIDMEELRYES